jgi:2-keto-3-deoxy-L-rhamnonate aldolase RhmA
MPTPNATRLVLPASALNMIIVSESSAKATQPVRTGRYTPTGCRSSAARSDSHRYLDARPISVHTNVLAKTCVHSCIPSI